MKKLLLLSVLGIVFLTGYSQQKKVYDINLDYAKQSGKHLKASSSYKLISKGCVVAGTALFITSVYVNEPLPNFYTGGMIVLSTASIVTNIIGDIQLYKAGKSLVSINPFTIKLNVKL